MNLSRFNIVSLGKNGLYACFRHTHTIRLSRDCERACAIHSQWLLDGTISGADDQFLHAHLKICKRCRRASKPVSPRDITAMTARALERFRAHRNKCAQARADEQ